MEPSTSQPHVAPWRETLFTVIFGVDTLAGRAFDVVLIWCIILSVTAVMLDSVAFIHDRYALLLYVVEWAFTLLFTVEYGARLLCVRRPLRYAISPFGLIDLLAVIPTYLSLFVTGAQTLLVIRALRLLRVFRVFKLTQYLSEADVLIDALRASRRKITVFILSVLSVAVVMGALMYLIEGEEGGFTSIPRGMYWAIVTMTTVGYGDIAPQTVLGQTCAAALMILGYAIIAVPTGIVSVELSQATRARADARRCSQCEHGGHDADAQFCKFCGATL